MRRDSLRLLKTIAKSGEISLERAVRIAPLRHKDHRDQYPLALLLEAGYLGCIIAYQPPVGAEKMREFALAATLHMLTLPANSEGVIEYLGARASVIDPAKEKVFLKAKGALHLDELTQKFWERLWSFLLGLSTGLLTAVAVAWFKKVLHFN